MTKVAARVESESSRFAPSKLTKVLIVDDHELLRDALRRLVDQQAGLEVCSEASDEEEARQSVHDQQPDLAIVDLSLKQSSGLDLIKWIVKERPGTKVIVSTMHDERDYGERVLRAGAVGYVNKQQPARTILTAIANVMEDKLFFSDSLTSRVMKRNTTGSIVGDESPVAALSNRELDIFSLVGQGLTTHEIATRLSLSPNTIGTYRERLKIKLNLGSSAEVTRLATLWVAEQS